MKNRKAYINNNYKQITIISIISLFLAVTALFILLPLRSKSYNSDLDAVKAGTGFTNVGTLEHSGYSSLVMKNETIYMVTSDITTDKYSWDRFTIEENATAVIYVAKGCTLYANAGITIPSNSTLILVGDGKIIAKGADAEDGENGRDGGDGERMDLGGSSGSDWWLLAGRPKDIYSGSPYAPPTFDYAGQGGSGGRGASSGIGGSGGSGGFNWINRVNENYLLEEENNNNVVVGNAGRDGENGGDGGTMGTLYVLGNITVEATAGACDTVNGNPGAAGNNVNNQTTTKSGGFLGIGQKTHYHQHNAGGQGGGGAGGGGGAASNIGGGGYGGGAGGNGATGNCANASDTTTVPNCNGKGGAGGQGRTGWASSGGQKNVASNSASGGKGGARGSKGGDGKMYTQNATYVSGRYRDGIVSGNMSQLQYTIKFNNQGGTSTSNKTVYLGQSVSRASVPTRTGYSFNGYYTGENGTGTRYFDSTGYYYNSVGTYNGCWDTVGDITLYASWNIIPYSVTLNKYEGVEGTNNITAYYGQAMPSISVPHKTGYNFQGYYWNQNGGGKKYYDAVGNSVNNWDKDFNTSLEAYWTPKSFQVSYNANGGSGSMTSRQFNFGQPTQLAENEFEKTGYTFMGWSEGGAVDDNYNATEQAKKVKYADKGLLTLDKEAGKELYAVWRNNKYYVRYNANGTTADPVTGTTNNSTHYYDIKSDLAENGYSRRGFSFIGWSTNPNATTASQCISSATTLTSTDNSTVELYAIWHRNTYTISFNSNGGKGATSILPMLYNNGEYTLPNCGFTKVGYLFKGWMKKEADAKNEEIKDVDFKNCAKVNSYDYVANTTFYAKWEATWAATTKTSFSGGSGTQTSPFKISTAEDLAYLSKMVQSGNSYGDINSRTYFEQTAPIILTGKIWMPIGGNNTDAAFGGIYNGRGFAIIGLQTYDQTDANGNPLFSGVGLFGRTNGAKLENVYLANAKVVGKNNVGALVGENYGTNLTLEGCFVRGNVTGSSNVGGLVGYDNVATMQISNCGFAGDVKGGSIIAGAMTNGVIKNCYAEVSSDISFCGNNANIIACVYTAGGNKRYYNDTAKGDNYFADWKTYNGKPLPKGLTWMGGVASGSFSLDGYTNVG